MASRLWDLAISLQPPSSPSHTPLQLHWPPHSSSDLLDPVLPQGLCASSAGCLECSSPRYLCAHSSPPSSLCLNVNFFNVAYPCYSNTATCSPAFAFLPFIPCPPEVLYFFPKHFITSILLCHLCLLCVVCVPL